MSYKLLKVPPLEGFHPPPETSKTDPYLQVTTSSNSVISIQVTTAPSSSALKSEVVSSTASLGNRLNLDRPRLEPESYGIEKPLSYRLLPEILMPPPPVPRQYEPGHKPRMVFKQEFGVMKQEGFNVPKHEPGAPVFKESKQQEEYEQYFRKLDSKSTQIPGSDLVGQGSSFRVGKEDPETRESRDQDPRFHGEGSGPPVSPGGSQRVSSTTRCEGDKNSDIEFDGNDCVLCRVCGDKASGFHYGVHSCEGCKGFFRRSIQQKIQYRPCSKNQQCSILRINRNRCQYCRLKKCIAAGMSRDAVRFGRVPKREKAKILAAMQSSKAKIMESRVLFEMSDERKIIDTIVRAHYDTCDYTVEKIKPFISAAQIQPKLTTCTGQTCPMKGGPEQSFLDEFSDRFMDHVRQVCTFAKCIPGFKCLQHDDQVTLLKSCVFEVLTVRLSGLFSNQSLVCLNGDVIRRETISAMPAGNAKFLMDSVFELAQRINRFRLSDAEIGLFCSVVIITADRPGLRNPELVGKMQSKLKNVLQNILVPQHPQNTTMFSELLTIIHDLRTLNTLHTEKFLHQAKATRDEVHAATSPQSNHSQVMYDRDWEDNNMDQDSTGSRSPQSSDSPATSHSFSMEDLRRSPMGSVSSSESLGNSEPFSKLSVNDLKIHGVGSVLLNALTSPALSQVGGNRKREMSRLSETGARSQGELGTSSREQKCPFNTRKLDSPSDSGIDSPKAQGSQSTNTSVCSSPRSSMEEAQGGEEERHESLEEQHPLLKRALQQPPQPFNMGGVSMFQDEVYKPHKKFRHSGRRDGDEPTSSTQDSSSPGPSLVHTHSILATQLAAPPSFSQTRRSPPPQSLLASTLSRPVSVARAKRDEERSELLANLILDSGRYRPGKSQSLLMCAPLPAHTNIPELWGAQSTSRHIPVPVAPSQPSSSTLASPRPASRPIETQKSSQLRSALTDSQPLNLSVRTPPPPSNSIPAERA